MKTIYLSLLFCLSLSLSFAQTYSVKATLNGANSVPANSSTGTGYLTGIYDASTNMIELFVSYTDLEGTLTLAHLHSGAAGSTGGVIRNLSPTTGASSGTISGTYNIDANDEAGLIAGDVYINLHSSVYGAGEIRGQLGLVLTSDTNLQIEAFDGDIQVTNNIHGVIMTSPNGTCFGIRIEDSGALSTEVVECP